MTNRRIATDFCMCFAGRTNSGARPGACFGSGSDANSGTSAHAYLGSCTDTKSGAQTCACSGSCTNAYSGAETCAKTGTCACARSCCAALVRHADLFCASTLPLPYHYYYYYHCSYYTPIQAKLGLAASRQRFYYSLPTRPTLAPFPPCPLYGLFKPHAETFAATTVAAHMRNTGLLFHERRHSRLSFHLGAIVVFNKQLSCALECAKRNAQNISIVTECHTGCHTAGQRQSRRLSQTAQPMPAQPSARRAQSNSNCASQSLIWRLHAHQVSPPSTAQIWDVTSL